MEEVDVPPEAALIKSRREAMRPKLSQARAGELVGLSGTRWRQIENGYETARAGLQARVDAPADTLAHMARVLGITAEELRAVGRHDAAAELSNLESTDRRESHSPAKGHASANDVQTAAHDVEQDWATARNLVAAVLNQEQPSADLLKASRDSVAQIAAHLIIRILRSGYQTELEPHLARIYSERDRFFRQLWDGPGEPAYPWVPDAELSNDAEVTPSGMGVLADGVRSVGAGLTGEVEDRKHRGQEPR